MNEASRIEVGALPSNRDVKMRAGCASGASTQTDFLASLHCVPFLHLQFRKMEVQREKSLTVVDHNAVAFEIQKARKQHGP